MQKTLRIAGFLWLPLFLLVLLAVCIFLLVALRTDPKFDALSTILGVIIGGATTSLVQLTSQSRERALRLADERRQSEQQLTLQRLENTREHFIDEILQSQKIIQHLELVRVSHAAGRDDLVKRNDEAIQKLMEEPNFRVGLEGAATIFSLNSPVLNQLNDRLEQVSFPFTDLTLKSMTDEEFHERYERFQRESSKLLGEVYIELDKLRYRRIQE